MVRRILVIDDEDLIVRTLKNLLERMGFSVSVARTGTDALAVVEREQCDLIVADIRMPGMDGVETIRAIQSLREKEAKLRIPVIFITGYADEDIRQKAVSLNPVAYIFKPFDIPELVGKIKEVFI